MLWKNDIFTKFFFLNKKCFSKSKGQNFSKVFPPLPKNPSTIVLLKVPKYQKSKRENNGNCF
jgi:hypothetical protein